VDLISGKSKTQGERRKKKRRRKPVNHILCAPAYIPTLHNPTNAVHPTPYIPTLPLHTYSTYLDYPYKPTKHYIPTLPLHTYTTPTTPTTPTAQHTLHPTLQAGSTPAHLPRVNGHMVRRCGCDLLVIGYCVLRHLLAKLLHLKLLEPPGEGRGIEFPRKPAILSDCTIITAHKTRRI